MRISLVTLTRAVYVLWRALKPHWKDSSWLFLHKWSHNWLTTTFSKILEIKRRLEIGCNLLKHQEQVRIGFGLMTTGLTACSTLPNFILFFLKKRLIWSCIEVLIGHLWNILPDLDLRSSCCYRWVHNWGQALYCDSWVTGVVILLREMKLWFIGLQHLSLVSVYR